jgi:hypothetical protein
MHSEKKFIRVLCEEGYIFSVSVVVTVSVGGALNVTGGGGGYIYSGVMYCAGTVAEEWEGRGCCAKRRRQV